MRKKGIIDILAAILISSLITAGGLALYNYLNPKTQSLGGVFSPTAGNTYRLQSSIGSADTSITLSSFKEPISGTKYTMSYLNSTIEYGTLEPANTSKKEFVSFTGITQNSDGTALLTGVTRGLSFSYPYTASVTFQQTHSGGSIFILSDSPQLFNQYANVNNSQTITGAWAFNTVLPSTTLTATTTTQFITLGQANNIATQGAATSTETKGGIVRLGTQAETVSGFNGGAQDPTVVQTKNVTAVSASSKVVATNGSGYIDESFIQGGSSALLSDGSDGTLAVTSGTTTLTRDMYFSSTTISAGAVLDAANYKIYVTGTFTNNGTVQGGSGGAGGNGGNGTPGGAGTPGLAGAVVSAGTATTTGGAQGGTGGVGGGVGKTSTGISVVGIGLNGSAGGTGGTGGSSGQVGGASTGGATTTLASQFNFSQQHFVSIANYLATTTQTNLQGAAGSGGGGGGGAGGGGGTPAGGGGGGGSGATGGSIFIIAKQIAGNGKFISHGGTGGNGGDSSDGSGGGGGGGGGAGGAGGSGGLLFFLTHIYSFTGTLDNTGGNPGFHGTASGSGSPTSGSNGVAGKTGPQFIYIY